ncbi:MAG TPA: macrolide family glycosyltransferase [Streptosporangiaceae bacterium]|nr:macrolide family glycosyltransferase [Streptosporangiaceae bacterium]
MSKHLLFVASPAAGHVNPLLPVMAELGARGHRVTFASGPGHLPAARAVGARVAELPWTLDPTSLSRERFTTTSFIELLENLLDTAAPRLDALVADAQAGGTDVVCFDATVAPIGAAIAGRLGVPAISCIPSMAINEHLPLAELLPSDFRPDNAALVRYASRLYDFSVEQGLTTPLAPMAVQPVPLTLVFVPPAFQIAADTFDASYRFVGPTLQPGTEWQPSGDGRPLALVSLGSAFNDRPDVFRACAAAFADTDWHVVMSIGRTTRESLGPLPGNVEAAPSVAQQAILRQATAFISHAGMNSIMEALACAVPLVTLPQVPEQGLNARRVKELGLGELLDGDSLTPDNVRTAVLSVADNEQVRERLKWMAGEIAGAGGASAAADAILAQLERR